LSNSDKSRQVREARVAYDVPRIASNDEAADWYLEHDTSKLDVEEVPLSPRGRLVTVAIRLPEFEVDELKRRSARLGIGYTTYVRMLVNRHILDEEPIG
jgi:predicted DNA binding CopG/RHH family protein